MLKVTPEPLAAAHGLVMLDLDGVVYRSRFAVDGAVETLAALENPKAYLTNNASRPAATIADQLRGMGIMQVREADVITSAQAIARLMAKQMKAGAKVMVVGGSGLREAVATAGLTPVSSLSSDPLAVVQGFSPDLGWADLAEAAYAIESGLPWYVSNTDQTIPTSRGVAPGNGSLVAAVSAASGAEPVAIAGKPYPVLFNEAVNRLNGVNPIMVGDRLDTDIVGARRVGITTLAVLSGVETAQSIADAIPQERPDYVGVDLRCLLEPHPPVEIDGLQASCGEAVVSMAGDLIEAVEPGTPLQRLRAATQLAWTLRDGGADRIVISGTIAA